jgi:hypothetical protein
MPRLGLFVPALLLAWTVVRELLEVWEHRPSRGCRCALIAFDWHPFDCPIHAHQPTSPPSSR